MNRQQVTPLPSALLPPTDGEQLLPKEKRRNETNTEDYELMHEEPLKPVIKKVPAWFYTTTGLCNLSMAASLWWANFVCAIMHTILMIVSIAVSMRDGNFGTPTLSVYVTNLTWLPGTSDPFLPMYQKTTGIALPVLVLLFFLLSAMAHTIVCALNWKQAFATGFTENLFDAERSKISTFTGWYYVWLHQCRNPLRCACGAVGTEVPTPLFQFTSLTLTAPLLTFAGGSSTRSPPP